MSNISPLAHVDPTAEIGENVTIHPFAFISKNTEIGDGCIIYPYVSILTGARIGKNNKIYNGAIIAAEPQDFHWHGEPSFCYIGDNNIIREHTIINRGSQTERGTRIGNHCFMMAETHIGHDVELSDRCVIGNGVQIAGRSKIHSYVIMSSNSMLHSGSEVGRFVMVKGGCRISGNVPPYIVVAHNPTQYAGINAVTMRAVGLSEECIDNVAKTYRHIYESSTSVFNAVKRIKEDIPESKERERILTFIQEHDNKIVAVNSNANEEF